LQGTEDPARIRTHRRAQALIIMQTSTTIVDKQHDGMRLDAFVAETVPGVSRSQAKRLIDQGHVIVAGREAKPSLAVSAGDSVSVTIPPPVEPSAAPEDIPLEIIHEDDDVIVINKPAGLVVHPAAGHPSGTLVNALLSHCGGLSSVGGEMRAGIVHRLDVGTSGVMVATKNDAAHRSLTSQFQARTVEKVYVAMVLGSLRTESGSFDAPLGRSRGDRKRISSHTTKGRVALTDWRVLERFGKALCWVEVTLHTGRTHQIRAHFAEAGHALVGDPLYGGEKKLSRVPAGPMRDAVESLGRPALHAWRLGFDHPRTGKRMRFTAPLPDDLESLLKALRKAAT